MRKVVLVLILAMVTLTANAAVFFFEADDYGTVITTEDVQMTDGQIEQIVNYGYELANFESHKAYSVECEDELGEYKYVVFLSDQEAALIKKLKKEKQMKRRGTKCNRLIL